MFTAKRVHKCSPNYQMSVIYGQGEMRQTREELRGCCGEVSPGEEAAVQPRAPKDGGEGQATGTWAQGQRWERRAEAALRSVLVPGCL